MGAMRRFSLIVKYVLVSVGMYFAVLSTMCLFVQVLGLPKVLSYIVTYMLAYVADYLINLRVLFTKTHTIKIALSYLAQIAVFLAMGAFIFDALIGIRVNYLVATITTAIVLMPVRFMVFKYLVFK